MHVKTVNTWQDFEALQPAWEAVHDRDCEAGYFLSWAWLAEVFRENPNRWRVLAVCERGETDPVCFLPLKCRTRWSSSERRFKTGLGAAGKLSWAQYTGDVCLPGYEEKAVDALADALLQTPWSRLSFQHLSTGSRLNGILDRFPARDYKVRQRSQKISGGTVDNLICPVVELPDDYETYLGTGPGSNTRQKLRRFWRKFEADEDLQITDGTPATLERDLDLLLNFWTKNWAPVRGRSSAERAAGKYREILRQSNRLGAVHTCILWRKSQPLGGLCSIVDRKARYLYFIMSGRDETVREPNVGMLLHAHNIQWAIRHGVRRYDFCHGNEAYKYSYGATDRKTAYYEILRQPGCETGLLDPAHVGDAMRKTIAMLDDNRVEEAARACRQILPLVSAV